MTAKAYNVVTTVCLAVAVGSAIMFDKAGHHNWVAGAAGIAAAICAASAYFRNSGADDSCKQDGVRPSLPAAASPASLAEIGRSTWAARQPIPDAEWSGVQGSLWPMLQGSAVPSQSSRLRLYVSGHLLYEQHHPAVVVFGRRARDVVSGRHVLVDEIVQLVERLSPTCEVELALDGRITIRRSKTSERGGFAAHAAPKQYAEA